MLFTAKKFVFSNDNLLKNANNNNILEISSLKIIKFLELDLSVLHDIFFVYSFHIGICM